MTCIFTYIISMIFKNWRFSKSNLLFEILLIVCNRWRNGLILKMNVHKLNKSLLLTRYHFRFDFFIEQKSRHGKEKTNIKQFPEGGKLFICLEVGNFNVWGSIDEFQPLRIRDFTSKMTSAHYVAILEEIVLPIRNSRENVIFIQVSNHSNNESFDTSFYHLDVRIRVKSVSQI